MTLQPFSLAVAGSTVAGLRSPVSGGLRVLALHGWLDNAASFVPLAAQLPGLELVAIDLPGHGHSAHLPIGAVYTTPAAITHVLDVADALGWDRFTLIGHSMGAGIASPSAASAVRTARSLLPLAVGPAMSASGGKWAVSEGERSVLIARLIAEPETLGDNLALAMEQIEDAGWEVAGAGMLADHTGLHLTYQLLRTGVVSIEQRLTSIEQRLAVLEAKG
jgi:pimeloyl-ACP methyl ester carboxylesterase